MLLQSLQRSLESLYDLSVDCVVDDFLFTDPALLPQALRHPLIDEQVLIAEGDPASVGVFLDASLLARLALDSPFSALTSANIADYWAALEAVSHFLCVASRAADNRGVSLLELELQAEIDKFILSWELLRAQTGRIPRELHYVLFERTRIEPLIAGDKYGLYVRAHQYAARLCAGFAQSVSTSFWDEPVALCELRRFYRLSASAKIHYIDRRC